MSKLELKYLIYGQAAGKIFTVCIKDSRDISALQMEIRSQQPALACFAATDFVIWKVFPPIPYPEIEERLESMQNLADAGYIKLDPRQDISESLESPPLGGHLHIIVQLPPQSALKRSRSPQSLDNTKRSRIEVADWLLELHGKIWNQQGRQQELFHTVKLTIAHYENLEERMAKLYPDRQEEGYLAGSVGVLSAKLAVLKSNDFPSITPDPGPGHLVHPTNRDDEQLDNDNDVNDELRSIFPFTIEYLDLSSLGLQTPPPRMPLLLLVRQEYNFLSKLLDSLPKDGDGSAIISGQPGVGKTTYLYFRLIQCMIAGIPCLFQTMEGTVYHVSESVAIVHSWSGGHIVAFCDADGDSSKPSQFILENNMIQIVAASPPNGAYEKWTGKMPSDSYVTKLVTALWSPHELFLTGMFLRPRDLLYSRLKKSTFYFGFNPHNCFNASSASRNLVEKRQYILEKVRDIPDLRTFLDQTRSKESLSHSIFQLSPRDDLRLLNQAGVTAVSLWALDVLLGACEARQADASFKFYNLIANVPQWGILRGQIFERQVLRYFGSLKEPEHFTIRCLADSTTSQWTYPGPTECSLFQSSTVTQLLQDAVADKKPRHLVPKEPYFPAVGSILYNPGKVIACAQITNRTEHPVAVVGPERSQVWLKRNTPLLNLRPSVLGNHWQLIFVVPDSIAPSFMEQPFKDDTITGEWSKKVDQYVLGLKEAAIWGRATK